MKGAKKAREQGLDATARDCRAHGLVRISCLYRNYGVSFDLYY
ncbi:MAG: hypothetical protein QXS96_07200 [Candidatus Caldarchaeum sp.]